jgi:hypothetical protein
MPPVWSAEQLNRWLLQTEETFVNEYNCIIDRLALDIVSGTDVYLLPDYVINIRRITYRGIKLDPISHRDQREALDGLTSQGRPDCYVFNNLGQMNIRLFPAPSETLVSTQLDLFNPDVIREQCIVEFYAAPNGITYQIPDYFRRRMLKAGVLKYAFTAEGKGQNIKAAKYWSAKWQALKELYGDHLYDTLNTPRRLIQTDFYGQFPAFATLPRDRFGIGLNPGE